MSNFIDFVDSKMDMTKADLCGVYPKSVIKKEDVCVFMANEDGVDFLVVFGDSVGFSGEQISTNSKKTCIKAKLNHENANALRKLFKFTSPIAPLRNKRSIGLGDRLGVATDGHILAVEHYDIVPVFAQQSTRELNLTNRSYGEVLDCVSFAVFKNGFKKGFGADGDHLKSEEEVKNAIDCGYTMITLDCSEYIDNLIEKMSDEQVNVAYQYNAELETIYLKKDHKVGDEIIRIDNISFKRATLIYLKAIDFAKTIYNKYIKDAAYEIDFEMSIDETSTPTTPTQHFFVASELIRAKINFATIAPRFCGEFQKGVDYRGDICQFEKEIKIHAAIAKQLGYKLSIHSGSDKFSVFELIGKYTEGNFHIKTAGTSWLEAMLLVAKKDPPLYREIHKFALSVFSQATAYYHVSTQLNKIPDINSVDDEQLPKLFELDDLRQLIHITYGLILNEKNKNGSFVFKDRLYDLWKREHKSYCDLLQTHIEKHLNLLYKGIAE